MNIPSHRSLFWAFTLILISFSRPDSLSAQGNPNCFGLFFPTLHAQPGDTVCLPLRVLNFEGIGAIQFATRWDTTKLELLDLDYNVGSELPGLEIYHFNYIPVDGYLRFAYDDATGMGQTMPDSAMLFHICFKVKNGASGFADVKIDPNLSPKYEAVELVPPDWHFEYQPFAVQTGGVQIGTGQESTLSLSSCCVKDAVCIATAGSISITASGGTAPYLYNWQGPNGFTANTADLSGLLSGAYQFTITDQEGNEAKGEIWVDGTPPNINISYSVLPSNCGAGDGAVKLHVTGSNPPFSYEWSAGNSTTDQNIQLPSGPNSVTVSDQNGCSRVLNFEVPNIDSIIVDIVRTDIYVCGEKGALFLFPYPIDGDYTFQWSNGSTDWAIGNLSEGTYTVTVTNANGCSAVKEGTVYNWNTYLLEPLLTPYCDPLNPTAGSLWLSCQPLYALKFPLTINWSNGAVHTIFQAPAGGNTVIDTLQGIPQGDYTAVITNSEGCTVSASATLECNISPPVEVTGFPAFYIKDDYLTPQYAVDSCAGVYGRNLTGLRSIAFSLYYPSNAVEVKGVKSLNLPGLTSDDFTFYPNANLIDVKWDSPYSLNIADDSLLFEVCFDVFQNPQAFDLVFTNWFERKPKLLDIYGLEKPMIGMNGYVISGLYFPPGPSICDFEVTVPDCASDNYYGITFNSCNPNKTLSGFWSWTNINNTGGVSSDQLGQLHFAEPGTYYITAWQAASSNSELFVYLPPQPAAEACVWPGDADNNNVVNQYDLLYLGLAYGAQGNTRENAVDEWTGQSCADWTQSTFVRQVNFKNMDANGDGVINASDTTAIVQNWGSVIRPGVDDPFSAPAGAPNGNTFPLISLPSDTIQAGEVFSLPLSVGSSDMPMGNIYGLAFSIVYDPELINEKLHFQPSNSWLGDTTEYLCIQKNFHDAGHLDVAITRIDQMPVSGWGGIGDLFIIIEDDIFGDPSPAGPQDTMIKTNLLFHDIHSLDAEEKPMGLEGMPAELVLRQSASGLHDRPDAGNEIAVMPNPASREIFVRSSGDPVLKAILYDQTGREINTWFPETPNARLSLDQAPEGACFLRIFTRSGSTLKPIQIIH